jgi:opacity protein-like surface antigen
MKKFTIFIFAFLWVSVFSVQADLKFGVKAGANLSKVAFNLDAIQPDNYTGFQVGPILELNLPIPIGLDVAVLYSQQGLKYKGLSYEEKMSTLDVPVNLKYKLHLLDLLGVYVTAGPYASFQLSDEHTFDQLKVDANNKKFGVGINLGGGLELLSHLQVGVNYQMGINDDYSGGVEFADFWDNIQGKVKGKTRIWSITAAYFF